MSLNKISVWIIVFIIAVAIILFISYNKENFQPTLANPCSNCYKKRDNKIYKMCGNFNSNGKLINTFESPCN